MNTKSKTTQRKRGRPTGKGRAPLSLEERRARNSQYERERRIEHAQAVAELVEASGFDPGMSFHNMLRLVCCYLKGKSRRGKEESVESLRQMNNDLLQRIKQTKASLAAPTPAQLPTDEEHCSMRTRPFMYMRNLKKERISIESSENTSESIKTEVDINVNPTQTVQPALKRVKIRTERATAHAPTKIKTAVDTCVNPTQTVQPVFKRMKTGTERAEPTAHVPIIIITEVDTNVNPTQTVQPASKRVKIRTERAEPTAHAPMKIKTEVDANVNPTQTVQPASKRVKIRTERAEPTAQAPIKIKTEFNTETMPDIIPERNLHKQKEILEPNTACATVKIKTEADTETMPDIINERKLHKRTQITELITACATVQIKTEADTKTMADLKYERIPLRDTESRRLAQTDKELNPQETQWWPQEIPLQADPLILGLFTETEAKHDIVQYYINLLMNEGYYGGATTGTSEPSVPQTNEDRAVLRTTYQG